MDMSYELYAMWDKPFFAPPGWLFGPVWAGLYAIIFITFGYVLWQILKGRIPQYIFLPFGLNLLFNLMFSPLQFAWQNLALAALDIILVWGTIVWLMLWIYPYRRWLTWAQVPYLLWVSFATVLQLSIWWLN